MSWTFSQSINASGFGMFFIKVWEQEGDDYDITFLRNVPTQIQQLNYADPFSDSTAVILLPQLTGFDGPSGDTPWLKEFTNVDVLWVPASSTQLSETETAIINPTTQAQNLWLHESLAETVWEGFVLSIESTNDGVVLQCQGALWQLDRYYAKPLNPYRPKTVESVISSYFDNRRRGLWTKPLRIEWPENWNIQYDALAYSKFAQQGDRYVPTDVNYELSPNWTGYVTRDTGGWDKILTGYINGKLGILYAQPDVGDPLLSKGDQWTIYKEAGRQPVMKVRRQTLDPTLVAWYGQPGLTARLTRDGNTASNVVFGRGTGVDGTQWDERVYPDNVPWNTYTPLAWDDNTYRGNEAGFPLRDLYDGYNAKYEREHNITVIERYVNNFPAGIELEEAQKIAENWIERDKEPGWYGTIELQADLLDADDNPVSKWKIMPGDVILLKGFYGTGSAAVQGTNVFHISQVTKNPMDGTVSLTVDTKFRDLLSVEEAMNAGRDSLSAVKSLQVGKRSSMVEDLVVPWSNSQGSGYIPRQSKEFVKTDHVFPYTGNTTSSGQRPRDVFQNPWLPGGKGDPVQGDIKNAAGGSNFMMLSNTTKTGKSPLYVPVHAGALNPSLRWGVVPVLMSQAGQISRVEFCAYDADGNVAPIEYHVSFYMNSAMHISNMPRQDNGLGPTKANYAALWDGAFETIDPTTGLPYVDADPRRPDKAFKIGWGTYDRPAGYSPGAKNGGASTAQTPTGKLIDGATWDFNFVASNPGFPSTGKTASGKPIASSAVMGSVAIYAQIPSWYTQTQKNDYDWVYFVGRFYRDYTVGGSG